ncbi:MAG TPA: alpha/beta fold hydrolase [Pseudonocardia sp.]|jgi:pimeloyl-ACP methyl ester carboxylesterase|nr:alpha/beta fold hydrolase [Pseudonocardia sp.]
MPVTPLTGRRADRRAAPWSFGAPWGARGWYSDLAGPVHWVEFGAPKPGSSPTGAEAATPTGKTDPATDSPADTPANSLADTDTEAGAPPIVLVHGLGGSHLDWAPLGPGLAEGRRVVALDLRGFGLTPGEGRAATVMANVDLLDRFLREVLGRPAVLVGNSMGGLISLLQADRNPETVAGLALLDPALPQPGPRPELRVIGLALACVLPGIGELALRAERTFITPRQRVQNVLAHCFADPSRASDELVEALVAMAEWRLRRADNVAPFLAAIRSTIPLVAGRRHRGAMAAVQVPVLLIHGEQDRLVAAESSRAAAAANPRWRTRFLPGVGHMPQAEAPELVLDTMADWLADHPTLRAEPLS